MSYSLDLNYFGVIWPQWRAAAIPLLICFYMITCWRDTPKNHWLHIDNLALEEALAETIFFNHAPLSTTKGGKLITGWERQKGKHNSLPSYKLEHI